MSTAASSLAMGGGTRTAGSVLDRLLLLNAAMAAATLLFSSLADFLLYAALQVPLFLVALDSAYLIARRTFFRRLWNGLSIVYFVVLILDFSASHEILHPIARLLLFLQVAKLFDRHTSRDRMQLVAISFLQILAASVLTTEATLFFGLFLYLWSTVALMMALSVYRMGGESAQLPPGFRLSVIFTACVFALSMVIFFLIPRLSMGYLQGMRGGPTPVSGFTDQMDLDFSGSIRMDTSIVMRVRRLDGDGPLAEPVYWRGIAYTSYDGRQWVRSPSTHSLQRLGENHYDFGAAVAGGARHRFEFVVEPMDSDAIFIAGRPLALDGRFFWLVEDANRTLYARYQRYYRITYTEDAELREPPTNVPDAPVPAVLAPYLEIPPGEEQIAALAAEMSAGATTKYYVCRNIQEALRSRYTYSLDIRRDPSFNAIDDFLFHQKRGHCEYFATAMALLCRASGIPARVVSGYLDGEFNVAGNFYVVRQQNAHAWVEAWFAGPGWVSFDPSPISLDLEARSPKNLLARIRGYWDSYTLLWDQYILTYNLWDQFSAALQIAEYLRSFREWLHHASDQLLNLVRARKQPAIALALLAATLLAGLLRVRRRVSEIRRVSGTSARQRRRATHQATRLYARYLKQAARAGFRRRESETAIEFASRLPAAQRKAGLEFSDAYYAARFGGGDLHALETRLADAQQSLVRSR